MTYCVGILVSEGLMMLADTRTNAGLDNVATFRKLHSFEVPGERAIVVATAGNLATSQVVVTLLTEGFELPGEGASHTLYNVPTMFKAAHLVGQAIREAHRMENRHADQTAPFDVTILLGGQIEGRRLRLFMVYSAGNFMEASADTPFLQIGETKYGKPILDRSVTLKTPLDETVKLGLISMDSTMRSNLGVGPPLDLVVIKRDSIAVDVMQRIDHSDTYFTDLRQRWSQALRAAHQAIPMPPYLTTPRTSEPNGR